MNRLRYRFSFGLMGTTLSLGLVSVAMSACSSEVFVGNADGGAFQNAGGQAGQGDHVVGTGGHEVGAGGNPEASVPLDSGTDHPKNYGTPTRLPQSSIVVPEPIKQALDTASTMNAEKVRAAYPVPEYTALSYDPTQAAGLDLIQKSSLGLSAAELSKLGENGFAISTRTQFPSFPYGYKTIYLEDLPVYVSADSVLHAVHRTFDSLLESIEQQVLVPELNTLLAAMHGRLAAAGFDAQLGKDLDIYLAVARSLLADSTVATVDSSNTEVVAAFVAKARAASGHSMVSLFGSNRDEDFSQFTPRGHYAGTAALEAYFRAMMWLGRVDLRLIETQSDGTQVFYRQQFDDAVALRELMATDRSLWSHIDGIIGAFAGEHDSMTVEGLDGLLAVLGKSTLAETRALASETIAEEIMRNGWGAQRIASRIIIKDKPEGETLPTDRSFTLFGQRYTVDSHVFVNVTYDRVTGRMMPNPLDVAFAALGNNAALPLLASDLTNTSYAAGMAKSRVLVDAHEPAYWEGSLYTHWLSALRTLSPSVAPQTGMPSVTKTDAWQKRMLNTQLASWAELRHDTILYAKQSYTSGAVCEFPDAYVDPYPEVYARLGLLAQRVGEIGTALPSTMQTLKDTIGSWVTNFTTVVANLQKMAEDQQTGTPHSADLMAFINEAVRWDEQSVCGGALRTNLSGWYLRLFLSPQSGLEYEPTVADVHTQPTDEAGNDVGRVLHVGAGRVRSMVVTVETCSGPRAYAGLVSSYGEFVEENWKRLNDEDWERRIEAQPFPDAPWFKSVLAE